ncbi:MAG TPA: HAMP domain-containing sensor histidine kinase [Acidimicrobiales bacterium]
MRLRRHHLGLRARVITAGVLIALVLSVALALLAYQLTRSELVDDREQRAEAQAYLNARLLRTSLRAPDPDVAAILSSLEGNAGSAAIALVDGQWYAGSVGYSPESLPASLAGAVADGGAGRQITVVDGEPHVVVGVPIADPPARYFELVPLDDIDDALADLARGLAAGALVATLLGAVAGWYASGRVLRPIGRMADAASEIAEGDLHTRIDALGDPDLAPLQHSFNRMADSVQERIEREHRFTSDVSHEMRSPLAAMLSAIQIARRRDDPEAIDDVLAQLEERTQAFHDLVVDLLEISRVDAGVAELELEDVDLRALASAVLADMGLDGVRIDVAGTAPGTIRADKRRLGRMMINLLENAERYGGGPTRVEIAGSDGAVRIAVEDAGSGVPEHERRHIFGRFARGESARVTTGGTGLGLALVAEHARLHGGRVWVEDAPGAGARFVIELPEKGNDG